MTFVDPLPSADCRRRLKALADRVGSLSADAFIVSAHENVSYLTGFDGAGYVVVFAGGEALLVTDRRYTGQVEAQAESAGVQISFAAREGIRPVLELVPSLATVLFESEHVPMAQVLAFRNASAEISWEASLGLVEDLRLEKDEAEMARLALAASTVSEVFEKMGSILRPGMSEREACKAINHALDDYGSDGPAFRTMVASGPHTGYPHWAPSDRLLQQGEPIIVDAGARVDGYLSDMARVFCFGELSADFMAIAKIVLEAKSSAVEVLSPSATYESVDQAARSVIERAGLAHVISHPTGHNLGRVIHEHPFLALGVAEQISVNRVLTVEPGIYLHGVYGCRVEDMYAVTQDGVKQLTSTQLSPIVQF